MIYSIYALINPIDYKIFYIGLTTQLEKRYKTHKTGSYCFNWDRHERIKEIKNAGLTPNLIELEKTECTKSEALNVERKWINLFLKLGHPLTNAEWDYISEEERIKRSEGKYTQFIVT